MTEHDCMIEDPNDEDRAGALDDLRDALQEVEAHDDDYENRYTMVLVALMLARLAGLEAGFRIDPAEPEWPVVYIELPGDAQVSWHMPQHPKPFDGHDTPEKYARVRAFIEEGKRGKAHE